MTKSMQTPSKAKSSSKTKAKPKIIKLKPKKSTKSTSESALTPVASPPIPSIVPIPSSSTTIAPSIPTNTRLLSPDQLPMHLYVKSPTSKLDILVSAIEVTPLQIVAPMSDKSHIEDTTIEKEVVTQEKNVDAIGNIPVVEGEGEKEVENKEDSYGTSYNWTEDEDDEDDEEVNGEGGGEARSESDGTEPESEEENSSEESEGSMAIGNIATAPLEEVHEEERPKEPRSLLTPFVGDDDVDSDEDDLPISVVGKKVRKAYVKPTRPVPQARKEVAPLARTPFTRSKRKVVVEQIIKESRSAKKIRMKIPTVEPVVKLYEEYKSGPSL
ncbi:PREDICTED: nucleolin-like [Nicotiana attenuata]|uniref:nucleolin-like n=1 Tax=Nicotiana attenuata TaxID=49451 RepID=UPI00090504BF|nr:PREDICTED: nucleolin-like [Nicotiana attenuata]